MKIILEIKSIVKSILSINLILLIIVFFACKNKKTEQSSNSNVKDEIKVATTAMNDDPLSQNSLILSNVMAQTDIVYSTVVGYRPLRLDLYALVNDKTPKPLIIFVHGGGWTTGNKRATANFENWPKVLASLSKNGYIVVAVEYRLSGEAPFPAAIQDVKTAIRFLKANAIKYGIDTNKIAIWGGSAGANIAAMAAYTADTKALDPNNKTYKAISEKVNAFVGWYGPYDITAMIMDLKKVMGNKLPNPTIEGQELTETLGSLKYFHCENDCPEDVLLKASPISYVNALTPESLLLHGKEDKLVPYQQSQVLEKKLKNIGAKVQLVLIDSVGHGWVGDNYQQTKEGSQQAIELTFNYFNNLFTKN